MGEDVDEAFVGRATISLGDLGAGGGRAYQIAPSEISAAIDTTDLDVFAVEEAVLPNGREVVWTFPKASVTALEIELQAGR